MYLTLKTLLWIADLTLVESLSDVQLSLLKRLCVYYSGKEDREIYDEELFSEFESVGGWDWKGTLRFLVVNRIITPLADDPYDAETYRISPRVVEVVRFADWVESQPKTGAVGAVSESQVTPAGKDDWLTITEVAKTLDLWTGKKERRPDATKVRRMVDAGELRDNGKKGKTDRRISKASLLDYYKNKGLSFENEEA